MSIYKRGTGTAPDRKFGFVLTCLFMETNKYVLEIVGETDQYKSNFVWMLVTMLYCHQKEKSEENETEDNIIKDKFSPTFYDFHWRCIGFTFLKANCSFDHVC